jgi:hypothetical protein
MITKKILFLNLSLFVCFSSINIGHSVVYEVDNRKEVFEYLDGEAPLISEESLSSIAGMINHKNIKKQYFDGEIRYKISGDKLGSTKKFCSHVPFQNQITPVRCSGFLVAPDVILTAGFCIPDFKSCADFKWVFGFKNKEDTLSEDLFTTKENIYTCKTVLNKKSQKGYALVRLDRPVKGRTPLKLRSRGKVAVGSSLVMAGFPNGLPMKVVDDAVVKEVFKNSFKANLDAFGGNSGSPVFNLNTGLVEGILLEGESDYTFNRNRVCTEIKYCGQYGCREEKVLIIDPLLNN